MKPPGGGASNGHGFPYLLAPVTGLASKPPAGAAVGILEAREGLPPGHRPPCAGTDGHGATSGAHEDGPLESV